jgi:hypothetical protein
MERVLHQQLEQLCGSNNIFQKSYEGKHSKGLLKANLMTSMYSIELQLHLNRATCTKTQAAAVLQKPLTMTPLSVLMLKWHVVLARD